MLLRSRIKSSSQYGNDSAKALSILLVALCTLLFAYVLIGLQQFRLIERYALLYGLDRIAILGSLEDAEHQSRPLTEYDTARLFRAGRDHLFSNTTAQTFDEAGLSKIGLSGKLEIPSSVLITDVRTRIVGRCDVGVVQLQGEGSLVYFTVGYDTRLEVVPLKDVQMLALDLCSSSYEPEYNAFRIALSDGTFGYALPRDLAATLNVRMNSDVAQIGALRSAIPAKVAEFAVTSDDYVFLHSSELRITLGLTASQYSGRLYALDEFDRAVDDLFAVHTDRVSVQGLSASPEELVRYLPFLFFVLLWEIWRRARVMRLRRAVVTTYWMLGDNGDVLGRSGAVAFALAPLAVCVTVLITYSVSQGLFVVLFGYKLDFVSLATLRIESAPPDTWVEFDWYSVALIIPAMGMLIIGAVGTLELIRVRRNQVLGSLRGADS